MVSTETSSRIKALPAAIPVGTSTKLETSKREARAPRPSGRVSGSLPLASAAGCGRVYTEFESAGDDRIPCRRPSPSSVDTVKESAVFAAFDASSSAGPVDEVRGVQSAKPERHGRPAGSRAHFLKLNATGSRPVYLDSCVVLGLLRRGCGASCSLVPLGRGSGVRWGAAGFRCIA
jgi:hypothetical protein